MNTLAGENDRSKVNDARDRLLSGASSAGRKGSGNKKSLIREDTRRFGLIFGLLLFLLFLETVKPEWISPEIHFAIGRLPTLIKGLLIFLWLTSRDKVIHNRATIYFLLLMAVMVFDTMTARNWYYAYQGTKGMFVELCVYLVFVGYVRTIHNIDLYIRCFLFFSVIVAVQGIAGKGLIAYIPSLADENDFALLMNLLIPFAYFYGLEARTGLKRLLYYSMVGIFVTGTIVSFSRGGFVGLVPVFFYCWAKSPKKVIGAVLVGVAFIGMIAFAPDRYWEEMNTMKTLVLNDFEGYEQDTISDRVYSWKVAMQMYWDHPVFGVGPWNFNILFSVYDPSEEGLRHWGRAAHSLYFTLIAELGTVGVLLFVAMIVSTIKYNHWIRQHWRARAPAADREGWRNDERFVLARRCYYISLGTMGALLGVMVTGIFISVFYYPWIWKLVMLSAALYNASERLVEEAEKNASER